jgi:hypothetical protein
MPRWRVFTWIILVINALFLIWVITGIASSSNAVAACHADQYLSKEDCQNATGLGAGIGVAAVVAFWAFTDVILGVVWLITRPKLRTCPRCGTGVKKGRTVCPKCRFDFALAYQQPQMPPTPPQSTPPQTRRPPTVAALPPQVAPQPRRPDIN